jgi:hypothetical protein
VHPEVRARAEGGPAELVPPQCIGIDAPDVRHPTQSDAPFIVAAREQAALIQRLRDLPLGENVAGRLATAGFGLGIVQGAFAQSDQPRVQTGEQATPAPAIAMEQVLAQLKAEGYSEVYEIEREHDKYEVKAKNRDGRTVELYVDASTGKTLKTEEEDDD